jgi:hypothetical protein
MPTIDPETMPKVKSRVIVKDGFVDPFSFNMGRTMGAVASAWNFGNTPDEIADLHKTRPRIFRAGAADISWASTTALNDSGKNGWPDEMDRGCSIHHLARTIKPGEEWKMDLAISHGAVPDMLDERGNTPLFEAVRLNNAHAVRSLVERGAVPDLACPESGNAFHYAAHYGAADALADCIPRETRDSMIILLDAAGKTPMDIAEERMGRYVMSSAQYQARPMAPLDRQKTLSAIQSFSLAESMEAAGSRVKQNAQGRARV